MRRVRCLQDKRWNTVFFLIGLLVAVADQLSKAWIRSNLVEGQSLFKIGFAGITHIRNTGAAFGLFPEQSFALIIVALIGIVAILGYTFAVSHYFPWLNSWLSKSALGLLLGGTVGNLIDRLRFGYVTDFIDLSFWPAFNLADSAVTIGVIIFGYSLLRSARAEKH